MSPQIPESDILIPRDPSLDESTDEWPEFVLSNVHVHLPADKEATTNLLEAAEGYPLTMIGQLEPLDDEDAHLYRQAPTKKRVNVILENVYTFSYGQYGDGSTAIWAAGKAGWYTIKPGRAYKTIYNEMVEAVNTLYFIADAYRTPRKRGKGKTAITLPDYTATELFEKYAAEELGSSDAADGADKIYEHKEFLISSMLSGKEGLFWSKYPLYKHLYVKFPEIYARMKQRLFPNESKKIEAPKRAEMTNKVDTSKKSEASKEMVPPKARNTRQGSVDTTSSTTSSLKRKRGRPPKNTSPNPVDLISPDGSSEASSAIKEPISEAAGEDSAPKAPTGKSKYVPPRRTRVRSIADPTPEEPEPEAEEIATPAKDDSDEEMKHRARKNKSSLRPRASKASKSAARKGGKGPALDEHDDESILPPSPTGGKRIHDEPAESLRPPKRRNSRPHDDEGIDIPTSPSVSGDPDNATSPAASTPDASSNLSDLPLRALSHVPDRVQEDTWVCALDGCTHRVYAASNPDSQRLIREHYALHAYDDDERVQMVKKLQAPSLPASHLMERVKMQAKLDGFPGSLAERQMGARFPVGLMQRY